MPDDRLARTRRTLPDGYQFGHARTARVDAVPDVTVATARLEEIAAHPDRVVRGDALEQRLAEMT